ncbi:MAG: amino acid adenylation domain-containing protein [Nocardioides sp.]|nr:amino acid adenylation domain-containing protein [Nocardioides sp.]
MASDATGARTLLDMLERQVRQNPGGTAVTQGGQRLTFAELDSRSAALAQELVRLSPPTAGGDRTIGVLLEQSIDLLVSVWAILRSGAAYLPLEPDYPEERLAYMVADSGARVVLTRPGLVEDLRSALPPQVQIRSVRIPRGDAPRARSRAVVGPDQLAYVIYTSGSTGRPKGVAIPHGAIAHQMTWLHADGHLDDETTILHKTPISFDAAQWELLANAAGAHIVIGQPGLYRDPEALIQTVRTHGVTTLQAVPTLLRALVDTEKLGSVPTLTRVYSGGEALSAVLARDVLHHLPGARLTNLYGPTESTINVTTHVVCTLDLEPGCTPTVPIGRLVPGCTALVVAPDGSPVQPGETGELLIGGPQLARGYLNLPELTSERFKTVRWRGEEDRYYCTGDLVRQDPDGVAHFVGRRDSQVKLRGHRIELDEVSHRIEEHPWVRRAAAVVTEDARTGRDALVACIEFDPRQAALMDQGNHGAHHQSKASRVQVRAQLADPGVRTSDELRDKPVVALDHAAGSPEQRRRVFARKTYRYFEGGAVTRDDILGALAGPQRPAHRSDLSQLTMTGLGELLRWFGQFHSPERLLPKLAYASPGALYATQLLLSVRAVAGVPDGTYYYHPGTHELDQVSAGTPQDAQADEPLLRFHFLGRPDAVETVYTNNVQEVLEIEVGHMLGTLEEALADHGLAPVPVYDATQCELVEPGVSDVYLGAFDAVTHGSGHVPDLVRWYVQSHETGIDGVEPGLYRYSDGRLQKLGDGVIESRHVIAINQEVYKRSSFGVSMVADAPGHWLQYIALGRALHHLQSNQHGLGLMSSGYSSRSGHPLPAALRLDALLAAAGQPVGPSYFAVGGKVSQGQIGSEGMDEDKVHMRGPAEMIKDDLSRALPHYMVPSRTVVLDRLPLSPNGKIDVQALTETIRREHSVTDRRVVEPHNDTERWLAGLWTQYLDYAEISVEDDFFTMGGDSLTAMNMVNRINQERSIGMKVQTLFRFPRLRELAAQVDAAGYDDSRLIRLNDRTQGRPVFCWPGLGGSPVGLRQLGAAMSARPVWGIQAWGINAGEEPFSSIDSMARADIDQLMRVQPDGPYTLWGYSFGARVAFETAWQLEQAGREVDSLLLICPGNPLVEDATRTEGRSASYHDSTYLRILYSVFGATVRGEQVERCLRTVHDEDTFVEFMTRAMPGLEPNVVRRIVRIVERTFEFEYTFEELTGRRLNARVSVIKATGDDYSFLDATPRYAATEPTVLTLRGDHYSLLGDDVTELVEAIRAHRLLDPLSRPVDSTGLVDPTGLGQMTTGARGRLLPDAQPRPYEHEPEEMRT